MSVFRKGHRVRYTGNLMIACAGKEGDVVRTAKHGEHVYVRFDDEELGERQCYPASLLKLRRTPAHIERRDRLLQRYGS